MYTVVTFYKFVKLSDCLSLQSTLLAQLHTHKILGTIILAAEGINGTIAGTQGSISAVLDFLRSHTAFSDLTCQYSQSEFMPFRKTKVLIKPEIVTLGMPDIDPAQQSGIPVAPEDWNDLISEPDVLLIDTRNDYEIEAGTFRGAEDPNTPAFRDFPNYVKENLDPQKHKKIAMFCTGGIRCEKASAFLLQEGFESVYQLQGGILNYLAKTDPADSLWQGKCFIFDDRITLPPESIKNP